MEYEGGTISDQTHWIRLSVLKCIKDTIGTIANATRLLSYFLFLCRFVGAPNTVRGGYRLRFNDSWGAECDRAI